MERKIVEYLTENNSIKSVKEISTHLEKSDAILKRALTRLIEKNIIIRIGSKKNGYWKLNE